MEELRRLKALLSDGGSSVPFIVNIEIIRLFAALAFGSGSEIEVGGYLFGRRGHVGSDIANVCIHVDAVIVPDQVGGPDSFEDTDAGCEQLSAATAKVEDRQRTMVGWIHTHPKQTTCLSSIDMHTVRRHLLSFSAHIVKPILSKPLLGSQQARLQAEVGPGFIAIVLAPRDPQPQRIEAGIKLGVYTLTPETVGLVNACRRRGFHDCVGKYQDARHVVFSENTAVSPICINLRGTS